MPSKSTAPTLLADFLVSIEEIEPDHSVQPPRHSGLGCFLPPTWSTAYEKKNPNLFRWSLGRLTCISPNDPAWTTTGTLHSEVTIFSQQDSTDHLLAVGIDATGVDLTDGNHRWAVLSFRYIQVPNQPAGNVYSKLDLQGTEKKIASPGSRNLVNELLPECYDYSFQLDEQGQKIPPRQTSVGLIGNIPILIALAAFSAHPSRLRQTLESSVRLRQWVPHGNPSGRKW